MGGVGKISSFLFLAGLCLLLTACHPDNTAALAWEGTWERTIHVPRGFQGRCADETLMIAGKAWQLQVIVHSTFECEQPFLEIYYEGILEEVKIRKGTNDSDLRLQIHDIHLTGLVDVAGRDRAVLSASAVKELSAKYVPPNQQFFEQKAYLSADRSGMTADIYPPVLDFAIPGYSGPSIQSGYKRVRPGVGL